MAKANLNYYANIVFMYSGPQQLRNCISYTGGLLRPCQIMHQSNLSVTRLLVISRKQTSLIRCAFAGRTRSVGLVDFPLITYQLAPFAPSREI